MMRLTLVILFGIIGTALVFWLGTTENATLRQQLVHWQFWALSIQFLLVVGLSWLCVPKLLRVLAISRSALAGAAAISLLALVMTVAAAPKTNRIFYDEHIYQGIGQNLSDLGLAQMCNEGTVEYGQLQCARGEYNKQPYGYPYLLSVAYRLFGVNVDIAHVVNAVSLALLVWVVFLIATALFADTWVGLFSATVVALIPELLRWSHTAAAEPTATLFGALAVLATVFFVRSRQRIALVWTVAAVAWALQFRLESLLVIAVVLMLIGLYTPREFRSQSFWWATLLGVTLCVVYTGHLYAVRGEGWGTEADRMSLSFFWPNLQTNGWFYLWDARFPAVYSVLMLLGLVTHRGRGTASVAVYFVLFWGVFLFFYAGSYDYGADVRFSLMTYPALAVLAGCGAASLRQFGARLNLRHAGGLVMLGFFVQFLWYAPFVRAVGEEAWAARADVAFAHEVAPSLSGNATVLTHNPSVFLLKGVNAAQLSIATAEPGYVRDVLAKRHAGGVFLHWNFWCGVDDPVQQGFCGDALERFPHRLVTEHQERNFRYAFYRLSLPVAGESVQ